MCWCELNVIVHMVIIPGCLCVRVFVCVLACVHACMRMCVYNILYCFRHTDFTCICLICIIIMSVLRTLIGHLLYSCCFTCTDLDGGCSAEKGG